MIARVGEVAAGEGIAIDWDSALAANTLEAHRLMWLAEREHGAAVQSELAGKLFEMHFVLGGDISSARQLLEAGVAVGMERSRVDEFLASDEGLAEVRGQIDEARRLGIQAVPTFVFDRRYAVQGAQQIPVFLKALAAARDAGAGVAMDEDDRQSRDGTGRSAPASETTDSNCEEESCGV
jgi:predicted DsbA family dithiol-disulfide isomerase